MKKITVAALAALVLTLTSTPAIAGGITVRFSDDEVFVEKSGNGPHKEFVAKATDPATLVRVRFWRGVDDLDHNAEPLSIEMDKGKIVKQEMETTPPVWLLPRKEWADLQKEWADIREKEVRVEAVDFPAVRLEKPEILLVVEEITETGYVTMRAADPKSSYKEHRSQEEFAHLPPKGKAFKLGTLRGLLIPVIKDGDQEVAILPVVKK